MKISLACLGLISIVPVCAWVAPTSTVRSTSTRLYGGYEYDDSNGYNDPQPPGPVLNKWSRYVNSRRIPLDVVSSRIPRILTH